MTQTLKQQRTKLDIVTTMNTLLKTTPSKLPLAPFVRPQ